MKGVEAMLKFIKNLFSRKRSVPTVEVTGYRHGLLTFRSEEPLSLQELTIRTSTPAGLLQTKVDIQSYDMRSKEYLAKLEDDGKALESLDIDLSKLANVQKALRVSSRDLPQYMGITEEISLSGLRLCTQEPLETGAVIELNLDCDVAKIGMLRLKAEVEWSAHKANRTYHSGLRFKDLDPVTFRKLAQYIQLSRV